MDPGSILQQLQAQNPSLAAQLMHSAQSPGWNPMSGPMSGPMMNGVMNRGPLMAPPMMAPGMPSGPPPFDPGQMPPQLPGLNPSGPDNGGVLYQPPPLMPAPNMPNPQMQDARKNGMLNDLARWSQMHGIRRDLYGRPVL